MIRLILTCLLSLIPAMGWAAIAHDVTSTFSANSASSISGTHTPTSVTNGFVKICVSWQSGTLGTLDTVTYGGNAATLVDGQTETSSTDKRIEMWRYVGPVGGGSTVTATLNGTKNDIRMSVTTYTGVHQGAPLGTQVKSNTFSSTPSTVVSSAAGELVVDCGLTGASAGTITVGAGQTQRANFGDATNHQHLGSEETGAASVTMSWSGGAAFLSALVGVPLKPAAAGGVTGCGMRLLLGAGC